MAFSQTVISSGLNFLVVTKKQGWSGREEIKESDVKRMRKLLAYEDSDFHGYVRRSEKQRKVARSLYDKYLPILLGKGK